MSTVLITGASRGIGRTTSLQLAAAGWHVLAGVRRPEDGEQLLADASGAGSIRPVTLDITDAANVAALASSVPDRLDALVNNAGVVVDGPIEAMALEDLRHQLEINLIGQVAVTQAVLPAIRRSGGRIVFVSSVSGRISTPWTGAYNASKFALEGLVDALRIELRPWGLKVILVEPGSTDTDIWRGALDSIDATAEKLSDDQRELYGRHLEGMRRATRLIQRQTVPAKRVADAIERALSTARPRARYPVGVTSKVQLALSAMTPTPVMDAALALGTGVPRKIKR